jgi:hypothetical protein
MDTETLTFLKLMWVASDVVSYYEHVHQNYSLIFLFIIEHSHYIRVTDTLVV